MTEHLPECPHSEPALSPGFLVMCICDRLRACEQRVLDAARAAVEALEPLLDVEKRNGGYDCCGCTTPGKLLDDALAAIDALRQKP